MATNDSSRTFQDILLELMVANETMDKIEKNTASLVPALRTFVETQQKLPEIKVDVQVPEIKIPDVNVTVQAPEAPAVPMQAAAASENYSDGCCKAILDCTIKINDSLALLAEEAIFSGGILTQIRNSVNGMYELMVSGKRTEGLSKLQAAENKIESDKSKEIAPGAEIEYKSKGIKAELSTAGIISALAGMLTGFVTGVVLELTKILTSAFKILGKPLLDLIKRFPIKELYATLGRKLKVFARLAQLKLEPTIARIIKGFESIKLAGKMMFAAKFGKYLDPILDAFAEIKLQARALYRLKIKDIVESFITAITSRFTKITARAAEWIKPLSTAFSDFVKEIGGIGSKISKLRPSKIYMALLRSVEGLATAVDPISVLIRETAKRILRIPGRIMQWFKGLGILFNVGKAIGRAFAKLTVPLTIIMSAWDAVTGAIDGFKKTEGSIFTKLIGALKGGITGLLNGLVGGVADLLKSLLSWALGKLGFKEAEKFLDSFSFVKIISDTIEAIVDTGKAIFAPLLKFLPKIMSAMGAMGKTFSLLKIFPALFKLFSTAVTKLAWPITIAMSAYDAITGFIEGYEKGGFIEGLKTGLIKLLDGMFGLLFNIPIKLMQWIYTKLGWEDAAKSLEGVTFKTFITKLMEWGESLFTTIIDWLWSGTKTILKALLPESVQKMLGIAESKATGADTRKAAGAYRKPEMLENAAKMLNDPSVKQERKDDLIQNLKTNYGFTDEEIKSATSRIASASAESRIVNPQKDVTTANKVGAEMTEYQKDTAEVTATSAAPVVIAAGGGGSAPSVSNANMNNVTVNNSNLPDRTQTSVAPMLALGF